MNGLFSIASHNYSCACSDCNVRRNNSITGFCVDLGRGRDKESIVIFDRSLVDGSVFIRDIRFADEWKDMRMPKDE